MKRAVLTTLASLTLLGAAARAEGPPRPGPPRDVDVPSTTELTLPNGMRATLIPFGTLPKVTVELSVRTGNIDEAADQVWLSGLTGELMEEGTTARSAEEIALAAARMGGQLAVDVGFDTTEIEGDALSECGPELVKLIADVAQRPRLPEADVPRIRADLLRALSIAKSDPAQLAREKLGALLYPGHPYGRLFPEPAMLKGYSAAHARAFHEANFAAARAHLYVAGRFDAAAVEAAIRDAFGSWKRGAEPKRTPPVGRSAREIHVIDRPGAPQSVVRLALPVIERRHPDSIALEVTNTLLGGAFSSRIISNIREQKGYTYSPVSVLVDHRRTAYWVEAAEITTAVTGPALKEIFAEIDRLQAEPPSQEELSSIKRYMAGAFALQMSSRGSLINALEDVDLQGLPDDHLDTYVERVLAVTPEDVRRVAQKYLDDSRMTIVIAGDRAAIEAQIKPFATIR
ncbi:pitrilysin family protein [Sorangium sp. So ce302]|uniref:M16 family metallopeptidase n=1 Tax=unclassified Sorangium TaxID=2621164 RepID=UPI003F6324D7